MATLRMRVTTCAAAVALMAAALGATSVQAATTGPQDLVRQDPVVSQMDGRSAQLADVTGDGVLDLVGLPTTSGSTVLVVRQGDGSGGFGSATEHAVPRATHFFLLHLNSDLRLDLVSYDDFEYGALNVAVQMANPTAPGWQAPTTVTGFFCRHGLAAGDLNSDSLPDLVAGGCGAHVAFASSPGVFSSPTQISSESVFNPVVSDVTGDGVPDVVGVYFGYKVIPGRGDGTFGAVATWGDSLHVDNDDFRVGDVNGDGRPDLLSVTPYDDQLVVYVNQGGGGVFGSPVFSLTGYSFQISGLHDFDADGTQEVLTHGGFGTEFDIMNRTGAGSFNDTYTYSTSFSEVRKALAGDVNGDRLLDVVALSDSAMQVFLNSEVVATPTSSPSPSSTVTAPSSPSPTATASSSPSPTATASSSPSPTATASSSPAPTAPSATLDRLWGTDRLGTAIAISQDNWTSQEAQSVTLARWDTFPDALAGTPLAVAKGGPLLLTPPGSLSTNIGNEIKRVLPAGGTVYLLGGTAALSPVVAEAVKNLGYRVVRLGGADRYATAIAINKQLGSPSTIFEATGLSFPYALISGAVAASQDGVVVLTADRQMPAATRAYLDAHPGAQRVAVGPEASAADPSAMSITSANIYETSRLLATTFLPTSANVAVASGTVFADALSGGAHIGRLGGPLLLSDPHSLPVATGRYFDESADVIGSATLYGGTAALSTAVEDAIRSKLR